MYFLIENGDFALLCQFTRGYQLRSVTRVSIYHPHQQFYISPAARLRGWNRLGGPAGFTERFWGDGFQNPKNNYLNFPEAPKWMVYNGKTYWNWWFGSTTIFGTILKIKKNDKPNSAFGVFYVFASHHWRGTLRIFARLSTECEHRKCLCPSLKPFPFEKCGDFCGATKLVVIFVGSQEWG